MKYNLETFKTLKFVVIAIPTLVGRSNPIGASIYPATRAGGIASSLRLPAAGRLLAMTCNFVFQKSHLTILLLFLFVFVSVSSAQTDEQTIRNVLKDQVEAWNRGDIEGYMKGYWNSDSTVFNSGGTLTRGYSNVLARYKKSYATREKMGTLEFTDLVLRRLSPTAVVAMGVWKLTRVADAPGGRFTLIIEKKSEGWRITHDHTSSAEK